MWKEISRTTNLVIGWNITTCIWEFRTKDMILEVEIRKTYNIQAFVRKKWCNSNFMRLPVPEEQDINVALKKVEEFLNDNFKIIN